jgi:hypothetical protein
MRTKPKFQGFPFDHKIVKKDGCWVWTGRLDKDGYATHGPDRAHRLAYTACIGEIPVGLHLEPVTAAENNRRANAIRTHCKRGHEFTPKNTYIYHGRRKCRKCHTTVHRVNYQKKVKLAH